MHTTAAENAQRFFNTYVYPKNEEINILEIGSMIGGFNIRSLKPPNSHYVGVDISLANGVDVVLTDPYKMPFEDNTFDFAISSSCFEHSEFFWLSYLETIRVLKPNGIFYLNAPSNGAFHRFPMDYWRFFPDSGHGLVSWGNYNGHNSALLEQYTSDKETDIWSDYVAIFLKNSDYLSHYGVRIIDNFNNFTNGSKYPHTNIVNLLKW